MIVKVIIPFKCFVKKNIKKYIIRTKSIIWTIYSIKLLLRQIVFAQTSTPADTPTSNPTVQIRTPGPTSCICTLIISVTVKDYYKNKLIAGAQVSIIPGAYVTRTIWEPADSMQMAFLEKLDKLFYI